MLLCAGQLAACRKNEALPTFNRRAGEITWASREFDSHVCDIVLTAASEANMWPQEANVALCIFGNEHYASPRQHEGRSHTSISQSLWQLCKRCALPAHANRQESKTAIKNARRGQIVVTTQGKVLQVIAPQRSRCKPFGSPWKAGLHIKLAAVPVVPPCIFYIIPEGQWVPVQPIHPISTLPAFVRIAMDFEATTIRWVIT